MKLVSERGKAISQDLVGLFFEDINFAADGGLYAELIENRSFEAKEAFGTPGNFYAVDDLGYAWDAYSESEKQPRLQFVSGTPLSVVNPHYLRLTTTEANQGFSNKAYDGLYLKKNMTYKVSFYARAVEYAGEQIAVSAIKDGKVYANASVNIVPPCPYMPFYDVENKDIEEDTPWNGLIRNAMKYDDEKHCRQNDWIKYEADLVANDDVEGALFVITLPSAGVVEFDLISMIPEDAVEGVFRKDLYEALDEIKPAFIRFPGGCIVEGISVDNRYEWKKTVGELKDRRYMPNLWAYDDDRFKEGLEVQRPDAHYGQSFGIGFYEYFLLCEKLGAKALPVLNVGVSCQFRSSEIVPVDSEDFDEYIQDALDLIEFANGATDTKWGRLRAKMGHEASFNLKYVGIGNEQWETKYLDFYERYNRFEAAIHAKYPEIELIGSAGPGVDMPLTKDAWNFYYDGCKNNDKFCYAVDEHYYVSPQWMYDHVNFYDDYSRSVGVFAGEYAAHPEDRENTFEGALAEAALLTGIEKNGDVIRFASYAPLFNRVGHSQWKPDMIWFDNTKVYRTPSYYVQKLFARNKGVETIPMMDQEKELQKQQIYVSCVRDENNKTIVKVVNASEKEFDLDLSDENATPISADAKILVFESTGVKPEGLPEETKITESNTKINGGVKLSAKSFTIITF